MRSSVAANALRHGLVSYWPIVTTQGGMVLPDLVSGLDLYLGSGASIGMSSVGGSARPALHARARASGNYAALETHPRFQLTGPMSLSILTVSYEATPTDDVGLLAHWGGAGGFMLNYNVEYRVAFDGVNVILGTGVAAETGRWVTFTSTWDGATIRAYINGIEKASVAYASLTAITDNKLMINGYNLQSRGWDDGAYKHAALWNRCLTPTEVRALHADEEIMLRTFPLLPVNKPAAAVGGALLRRLHTEGLFVGSAY